MKRDYSGISRFRLAGLAVIIFLAITTYSIPAHPSSWILFESREKKKVAPRPPQPKAPEPKPAEPKPPEPKPSERIIRESKEKPVTFLKLSMEIQSLSNELEYYKKEIDNKRKERQNLLRQIGTNGAADQGKNGKTDNRSPDKTDRLNREIAKIDAEIRAKQEIAKDLEKELSGLKKRLDVLYWNWIYRLLLIIGAFAAAYLLSRGNRLLLRLFPMEDGNRQMAKRLTRIFLFSLASILTIFLSIENLAYVAAVLGLAIAGSAIAIKDVFISCAGWLVLMLTRRIRVGDFIETGGIAGKVLEISLLKMTVLEYKDYQETGRVVYLGNNLLFSQPVINSGLSANYIWDRIDICLSHQSDWKNGYTLLQDLLSQKTADSFARARQEIKESGRSPIQDLEPTIQTSIKDNGILFSLRYITDPQNFTKQRNELMEGILSALSAHKNLHFAPFAPY